MDEILRTNDMIELSWAQAVLSDAGIDWLLLDEHASAIEGSIGAIQRRLMVTDDDLEAAKKALKDAALSLKE